MLLSNRLERIGMLCNCDRDIKTVLLLLLLLLLSIVSSSMLSYSQYTLEMINFVTVITKVKFKYVKQSAS